MIPTTLVVIGPEPALAAAVARAERWLPYESAERTSYGLGGRGFGERGFGEHSCVVPGRVVQWQAVADATLRLPCTYASSPSGAWLASSGSWLPAAGPATSSAADPTQNYAKTPQNQSNRANAQRLLHLAEQGKLWPLPVDLHGQGTLFWQDHTATIFASCDSHGGGLLYYGAAGGLVVLANRASLVAAALAGDGQPQIQPVEVLWPLTKMGAPLGKETAFVGVSLLPQGALLQVDQGQITITAAPPTLPTQHNLDDLAHGLLRRPLALDAWPDHPVELMLSGGKDIRLVLAALQASGQLQRVTRAVMWAPAGDADLLVGQRLAAHLGLELRVLPSPIRVGPWQEGFLRHAFLGEGMVHAWDRKGSAEVRDVVTLNGYFGELYKSHVQHHFRLGRAAWRYHYNRAAWFDHHDLLTAAAHAHLRQRFGHWLQARETEDHPWHLLHDRWHREARMQRWVGHILQAEGCATPWLQLLPDAALLQHYMASPLRDRTQHRLHFALLQRLAPDLLNISLARDRWAPQLDRGWSAPAAQKHGGTVQSEQAKLWAEHGAEMADWLRSGKNDGLLEWVDGDKLERLLSRALRRPPAKPEMLGIMALLGVRAALAPMQPRPVRVVTAQ